MRRRLTVAIALAAVVGTTTAVAQESPLGLLRDLLTTPEAETPRSHVPGSTTTPLPRLRPQAASLTSVPHNARPVSACLASLKALGVVAQRRAPIREGRCGIADPVAVSALADGAVRLSRTAVLNCPAAAALARFVRDEANPAARAVTGGDLTGLRVAAAYVCRTRNSQPGARLSEHGRGNAIDISAFRLVDGSWIEVQGAEADGRRFVESVRKAACGPFKTVLGPGADAHHDDHLHLDLAERRNGSTYCR